MLEDMSVVTNVEEINLLVEVSVDGIVFILVELLVSRDGIIKDPL
jgi:hypothetical protein